MPRACRIRALPFITVGTNLRLVLLAAACLTAAGCGVKALLRENTKQIEATNQTVGQNTQAVNRSTSALTGLEEVLKNVVRLEEPLKQVAGFGPALSDLGRLDPTLKDLATLRQPLANLAGLGPDLNKIGAFGPSLTALSTIREPLDRVTELQPQLVRIAALSNTLGQLADLKPSLDAVLRLEEPLAQVLALKQPIEQAAALRKPIEDAAQLRSSLDALARVTSSLRSNAIWLALGLIGIMVLSTSVGVWVGVRLATRRLAQAVQTKAG